MTYLSYIFHTLHIYQNVNTTPFYPTLTQYILCLPKMPIEYTKNILFKKLLANFLIGSDT